MIKERFARNIDAGFRALFPFLFWRAISPNWLTACGAGVSLLSAVAFFQGRFLEAGLLVLGSGFFDIADGAVARHFGLATRFGALLDSTLDRLADLLLLLGLALHYAAQDRLDLALLVAYVLVTSVLTSYTKARAEAFLSEFKVGFFERGERLGTLALGAILQPFAMFEMFPRPIDSLQIALGVLAVCGTITVAQRLIVAQRELAALDRRSQNQ